MHCNRKHRPTPYQSLKGEGDVLCLESTSGHPRPLRIEPGLGLITIGAGHYPGSPHGWSADRRCGWYQAFRQLFPATGSSRNRRAGLGGLQGPSITRRIHTLFRPPILSYSSVNFKRVIVTPAVYPRLVEFLHFDIQSTGQKSHCVSVRKDHHNALF